MESGQQDSANGAVKLQNRNPPVRALGLAMMAVAAVAGKFLVLDKLEEFRKAHEAAVNYSHKLIMLPPVIFMIGLALLLGGARASEFFKDRRKWGFKQYALLIALILPAFAVQLWFDSELAKLGYQELR